MDSLRRNINSLVISLVHINNPRHAQASRFRSIRRYDPGFNSPFMRDRKICSRQLFKNFGMKDCF
eukprot:m.36579 g.36579  ORF g.36579 m.36579 type:complete len:65 (+) comp44709_c0_seq2:10-204(+)